LTAPDPAARIATRSSGHRDRIFLRGLTIETEIGAFQRERGITQRLRFDLVADLSETPPGAVSDDVDAIHDELAVGRHNLLETLAEGIAARVLAWPEVAQVSLRIDKLDRIEASLGIEIVRQRRVGVEVPEFPAEPDARVILLPEAQLVAPDLPARLSALIGDDPVILCVDAAALADTGLHPAVQRRIDLLAFEQAAWRLAARDPRFVVVDSRTELDWGLRNGQTSVWAPSKMVVDARGDAPASPLRMDALAIWLAGRLGAARIECAAGTDAALLPEGLELRRVSLAAAE